MHLARRSLVALTLCGLAGSLSFCGGDETVPASGGAAGAAGRATGGGGLATGGAAGVGPQAGQGGSLPAASGQGGAITGGAAGANAGQGGSGIAGQGGNEAGSAGAPIGGAGGSGDGGVGGQPGVAGQGGAQVGGAAGSGGTGQAEKPANIIFVLVDDLSWNLVPYMKNVQKMQDEGATFTNYFVTDSLCCPSRSSIFTGKMPHNTGVFANVGADGGYDTYLKNKNDEATFAVALNGAGYRTAMGGKLMNGYNTSSEKPKGWDDIFLASNGYPEYNYTLRQAGPTFGGSKLVDYGNAPADYLTDVMLRLSKQIINDAKDGPFMIEIATFAPHSPYVPAPRHANLFPNLKAPKGPSFNQKPTNPPPWLANKPALTKDDLDKIEDNFVNRAPMVQAVDELIGDIRELLAKTPKVEANTYIVFSSDNGFHLGEHALKAGKMTAFDTDINVPLIVVGPGVPKGKKIPQITQNIDLCPTFAELGQTNAPAMADGHSLVSLLHGQAPTDWRDAGLVEHHRADPDPGDPDVADPTDPPDYAALRTLKRLYVRYTASEVVEFYDVENDPLETKNIAGTMTPAQKQHWLDWLKQARACKGQKSCWDALHEPP